MSQFVMDAALGQYLDRELEYYDPKMYEVKYPMLQSRTVIPVRSGVGNPMEIRYSMMDKHATAALITDLADDLPTVDISLDSTTVKVQMLGNKAIWSIPELRAAQASASANPNVRALDMARMDVMREGVERKLDALLATGDSKTGLKGFVNHSAVNAANVANNAGATSRNWADKTADEILFDVSEMLETIIGNTLEVHTPNTLLIPPGQAVTLAMQRLNDVSDTTVLAFLKAKLQAIRPDFTVATYNRLTGAGTSNTDRCVMFERTPEVVEAFIVSEFERLPPQYRGLAVHVAGMMSTAGVVVRYPKAIEFRDQI